MLKRTLAMLLCILMLLPSLFACSNRAEDDLGAYITMYLTDEIYDFDPAKAYYNSGANAIVSLLFDTLFSLDENGNIKNALVKEYQIYEDSQKDEYTMTIILNNTKWSNGLPITADDVVYTWKRLLSPHNSFEAASLLFDIKNARAIKEGDETIDNLGAEATEPDVVKVTFEGKIDYEQFRLNLTSLATAPLPESYVEKDGDWAKKSSSMLTSGAFKIGQTSYVDVLDENGKPIRIKDDYALDKYGNPTGTTQNWNLKKFNYFYLERNPYYYRNDERSAIDTSVTPYRILVDCTLTDDEILKEYQDGHLFYVGNIPYSVRQKNEEYLKNQAKVTEALSTFVCSMNQNALIENKAGEPTKLFANKAVRQALSLAIDREAIAQQVVFASAATGLVPTGVFDAGTSGSFRNDDTKILATNKNLEEAKKLLTDAKITASNYSFTIKVAEYDDTNIAITKMIAAAWTALGFNVTVETVTTIVNNDILRAIAEESNNKPSDVCDDLFTEAILRAKYDVIAFDYNAFSADAYSVLSNFATPFSGMANSLTSKELTPHRTAYENVKYNNIMEAIYYLPYFAGLDRASDNTFLGENFYTKEEFQSLYDTIKGIYEKYQITPSTNSGDWASQKSKLLHEAEKILLDDMAIIPVLFNQNAVLISGELTNVGASYYAPAHFQKTNLKNYNDYSYTVRNVDANGNVVSEESNSIFAYFPEIYWEKKGTVEEKKTAVAKD